jgi:hypothetical protein
MKTKIKKIVYIIFILSFMITLFSCNYYYKDKILKYLKSDSDVNSERLAYYLSLPVWNFDSNEINKILNLEIMNQNILGIFIYSENEKLIAGKYNDNYFGNVENQEDKGNNFKINDIEEISLFSVKKDIIYNSENYNKKIGYFIIYYTDNNIKKIFN